MLLNALKSINYASQVFLPMIRSKIISIFFNFINSSFHLITFKFFLPPLMKMFNMTCIINIFLEDFTHQISSFHKFFLFNFCMFSKSRFTIFHFYHFMFLNHKTRLLRFCYGCSSKNIYFLTIIKSFLLFLFAFLFFFCTTKIFFYFNFVYLKFIFNLTFIFLIVKNFN